MAIECKHGRLARKCELCELEEALARISALEAERDRLKELLKEYMETCGTCDFIMMSCDLCAKTKASIGGEEQP